MDIKEDLVVIAIAFGLMAAILTVPVHAASGKVVYNKKCASCHGKDGKGKAKIAKAMKLDMKGLDLTDKATTSKKDSELIKATEDGVGKMKGYKKKLTAKEIKDVVAYLRGFSGGKKAGGKKESAKQSGKKVGPEIVALYKKKCASCHGKDGKGKARIAKALKLKMSDLDMTDKASTSKKDSVWIKAIAKGAGKMKGYEKKIKASDIKALVDYIRSF
jgi:cbb3-type cytochrome c oxidase subunit III